jgi:drug/metabolite transporter (DMT)-like permease
MKKLFKNRRKNIKSKPDIDKVEKQEKISIDFRIVIAIIFTLIFWASAFAGIRAGLKSYSPENLVLLRFLTASIILLAYAIITRMPLPEKRDLPAILFIGFRSTLFFITDRRIYYSAWSYNCEYWGEIGFCDHSLVINKE